MAARFNKITPLFTLNNRTYFYKETQTGSLMYYCKRGLGPSRIFQVKARDMMPLLKDDNVRMIK